MSNMHRGITLFNTEVSIFDIGGTDISLLDVEVWVENDGISGRMYHYNDSPLDYIEMFTEYTGRMESLPIWTQEGAIFGIEGGGEEVNGIFDKLVNAEVPVAGVWLQDWVVS